MTTAVTIWWGCWQWAHEAKAPRVAVVVEEQAPSVVESTRADYNDLESITQVATQVVDVDEPQKVALVAADSSDADEGMDAIAWPVDHSLLTFSRAVTELVLPGVVPDRESDEDAPVPDGPTRKEPVFLGDFQFTYYWITSEYAAPEAERTVQLYEEDCEPLYMATPAFANRLALEGTGRLVDGRTLNVDGECDCGGFSPCFFVTRRSQRWGVGVETRPLVPFRSVAVDTYYIPTGTRMYIPELDGLTMPGRSPYGGFVHDGCVVADDTGGGIDDSQIDIFFALKDHYRGFDRRHKIKSVRAYRDHERCSDPDDLDASPPQRISV